MRIERVELFQTSMELVQPFRTHLETVSERESILIKITDENGFEGWGEVVAFSSPWYTEETIETSWHMLTSFFIPTLLGKEWGHPREFHAELLSWRRNQMAKAGLEMAMWDLAAKRENVSLSRYIGGSRSFVEAGVVVGVDSPERMAASISKHLEEGYTRVKIKIEPEKDYEVVKHIRRAFPKLALMADANSAYTLKDVKRLQALDEFELLMIEQPLAVDDIVEHAELQKQLATPICLDESIVSYQDAKNAIALGSCQVMNVKIGRVGGLANAMAIHDLCQEHGLPVWCGGMLETGVSRAFNIALASLENFTIPGDISASSRYWKKDVILPEVLVKHGRITVPERPGIGFEVDEEYVRAISKRSLKLEA